MGIIDNLLRHTNIFTANLYHTTKEVHKTSLFLSRTTLAMKHFLWKTENAVSRKLPLRNSHRMTKACRTEKQGHEHNASRTQIDRLRENASKRWLSQSRWPHHAENRYGKNLQKRRKDNQKAEEKFRSLRTFRKPKSVQWTCHRRKEPLFVPKADMHACGVKKSATHTWNSWLHSATMSSEGQYFSNNSSTTEEARIDTQANSLWNTGFSRTFFDVKVFKAMRRPCPKQVKEARN